MTPRRLKHVATLVAGQSPPSEVVAPLIDGRPFLQGNAEFGLVHPQAKYEADLAPKRSVQGDLLISVRAPVGALNLANREYGIGRGLCAVRARSIDRRFLWWWAHTQVTALNAVATGSTYAAVSASDVGNLPVPDIPLDEQRRIADFLDSETARLDSLMARRAVQTSLLGERRASLLFELLGRVDGGPAARSGLPWLPTVPSHWSVVKLTLLARLGSGHTPSRSRPEWWVDATIPWITTGEVAQLRDDRVEELTETREMISQVGIANSAAELHPRGTVVLSRTASVGYSAVMGADMATSQDFATWTCGPRLDPYYLLWTLRAMRPWLLGARAMGSTHKTIYMPDIQALRLPLPPLAEQRAIVDRIRTELSALDAVRDVLDDQVELLRERRQALITAAVTGQLDVTTAQRATVSS